MQAAKACIEGSAADLGGYIIGKCIGSIEAPFKPFIRCTGRMHSGFLVVWNTGQQMICLPVSAYRLGLEALHLAGDAVREWSGSGKTAGSRPGPRNTWECPKEASGQERR